MPYCWRYLKNKHILWWTNKAEFTMDASHFQVLQLMHLEVHIRGLCPRLIQWTSPLIMVILMTDYIVIVNKEATKTKALLLRSLSDVLYGKWLHHYCFWLIAQIATVSASQAQPLAQCTYSGTGRITCSGICAAVNILVRINLGTLGYTHFLKNLSK